MASDSEPSVLEDLIDVLYQPAAVFKRRQESIAFGLAMVILTALTAAVFFATKSGFDPVLEAMVKQQSAEVLRQNPQLKPEQLAGATGIMRATMVGGLLVYPLLAPLLIGLFLWLVGKLFESKASFGAAIMAATYGYVPRFIGFVASALLAVLLPEDQITSFFSISFSPARFLDPATTSLGVLGAAARFDLFMIWQTIIAGIGISIFGGISRGRGLAVAALVWALGFLLLLPALLKG